MEAGPGRWMYRMTFRLKYEWLNLQNRCTQYVYRYVKVMYRKSQNTLIACSESFDQDECHIQILHTSSVLYDFP